MEKRSHVFWAVAVAAVLLSLCIGALGGLLIGGVAGFAVGRGWERAAMPAAAQVEMMPVPPVTLPPLPREPYAPVLPGTTGALVVWVGPGTPAAEAGLQPGDVIVAVDDEQVSASRPLPDLIAQYRPGRQVTLTVLRGDTRLRLQVKLDNHPDQPGHGYLGVRVQSLDERPSQWVP